MILVSSTSIRRVFEAMSQVAFESWIRFAPAPVKWIRVFPSTFWNSGSEMMIEF